MNDKKPVMLWHDDGNAFICSGCGEVVQRTRMNPYPEHECRKTDKPALGADPIEKPWQK